MFGLIDRAKRSIALRQMAKFFSKIERNPVTRTPSEVGLEFENVSFETKDGLTLKAWHIPSPQAKKIVIFNHFMLGNRRVLYPSRTGEI